MDSLVGYRFHPTPEELVSHFLKKKRLDPAFTDHTIREVNIYEHHPCELPGRSFQSNEQFWYFFCILDQKYANSGRARRTAKGGSWKKTGEDVIVKTKGTNKHIGFRKTLVFYKGSNFKKENKTNWVMHEYHAYHEDHRNKESVFKHEVVVCRIERKPDKNREPSSTLDEGQPSDNPVYDSGSNVAEDIVLKAEPDQLLQNHLDNTNLMELESQPLPKQHRSLNGEDLVTKRNSSEKESQLPPNQYLSSDMEDHDANEIFSELEPLDPPGWYNPLGDCKWLNHNSSGLSDDPKVWNAPLDTPDLMILNSSKTTFTETYCCDRSDEGTETIAALFNEFSSMANGEY
uniref:NAC transcription factor 24 n=1 Tax=Litchi chinensis TaxID=151069 RepID=A0A8K1HZP1_LITCN|nr:NAC transcription factor 24 [Litchi chinensis]